MSISEKIMSNKTPYLAHINVAIENHLLLQHTHYTLFSPVNILLRNWALTKSPAGPAGTYLAVSYKNNELEEEVRFLNFGDATLANCYAVCLANESCIIGRPLFLAIAHAGEQYSDVLKITSIHYHRHVTGRDIFDVNFNIFPPPTVYELTMRFTGPTREAAELLLKSVHASGNNIDRFSKYLADTEILLNNLEVLVLQRKSDSSELKLLPFENENYMVYQDRRDLLKLYWSDLINR